MHNLKRAAVPILAIGLALILSSCHALRLVDDFGVAYSSGTPFAINVYDGAHGSQGTGLVWADINSNCVSGVSGGDWGDVGSSETDIHQIGGSGPYYPYFTTLGTPPSSATVNCLLAEMQDDPNVSNDNESLLCSDNGTSSPDCQDPDGGGMGTYQLMSTETDAYQAAIDTYDEAEAYIVAVRDVYDQDSNTGAGTGCLAVAGQRCVKDPGSPGSAQRVPCGVAIRWDSNWVTGLTNNRTAALVPSCF